MLFHYLLDPTVPPKPRGVLTENDVICPLAFGQNSWFKGELASQLRSLFGEEAASWQKRSDIERFEQLAKLDYPGFSYFDPGAVNYSLATVCYQLATEGIESASNPRTIVGQWEVMYALFKINPEWYVDTWPRHHVIWPKYNAEYLSTRDVLETIYGQLPLEKRVVVVAQSAHLARVVRTADKIFGKNRVVVPAERVNQYDPESMQEWTRSEEAFVDYETVARLFEALPLSVQRRLRQWFAS